MPTIFNVVVDAVVCHWDSLVAGSMGRDNSNDDEAGQPTEGRTIRGKEDGRRRAEEGHALLKVQIAFFNAGGRMLASTDPVWLQTAFDMPTGIFDRVGLGTNFRKTVGMVCEPCRAVGVRTDEAYRLCTKGEGRSHQERQR